MHVEERLDLYSSSCIIRMIKESGMGGACGMYGEEEKCILDFGGEPGEGDQKELCVDNRILLKGILKKWGGREY